MLRGEAGELLLRGLGLAAGYWAAPGQVESLLDEDEWFHTGDLVRQDDGGQLLYVARKKELIVRGGANVAPSEVEQVLRTHPAVRDAAVLGVSNPELGQRVAVLVQLASEANKSVLDDIRSSAVARLADYEVPGRLQIVSAVPENALGEIDGGALPAMMSDVGVGVLLVE